MEHLCRVPKCPDLQHVVDELDVSRLALVCFPSIDDRTEVDLVLDTPLREFIEYCLQWSGRVCKKTGDEDVPAATPPHLKASATGWVN